MAKVEKTEKGVLPAILQGIMSGIGRYRGDLSHMILMENERGSLSWAGLALVAGTGGTPGG
jgi:hypothetical protein